MPPSSSSSSGPSFSSGSWRGGSCTTSTLLLALTGMAALWYGYQVVYSCGLSEDYRLGLLPPSLSGGARGSSTRTRHSDSAMTAAATAILAELSARATGRPTAQHVEAATRLLDLLDSSSSSADVRQKGLGGLTASVRALAESVLRRAQTIGTGLDSGEDEDAAEEEGGRSGGNGGNSLRRARRRGARSMDQEDEEDGEGGGRGDYSRREIDPFRFHTQQTCYLQSDESETCTFDNLLCFDGQSPIVTVETPSRDPERLMDYTHSCMDYRFYEPTALEFSGCSYVNAGARDYSATARREPTTDVPLPLKTRRWGPSNRNGGLIFKELTPREIWGDQPEKVLAAYGETYSRGAWSREKARQEASAVRAAAAAANAKATAAAQGELSPPIPSHLAPELPSGLTYDTEVVKPNSFEFPGVTGLRILTQTRVGNRTIDWVDGSVWLAGLDGQWNGNPYHWWSKVGALYDGQRVNATPGFGGHPSDGYAQWIAAFEVAAKQSITMSPRNHNRMMWKTGSQWDLPGMDYILFAGDGALEIANVDALGDWYKSVLRLATQTQSKYYFKDILTRLGDDHLVCMPKRTAIPSAKNKWFTGRADAWMLRQYAYQAAGLAANGVKSHPKYPPRRIAIIDRKNLNGRGIYNRDEVLEAVRATGLPYEVVPSMNALSFKQQVALMSRTGIVVAPHGAALANSMFLPAHSAVVELFPYLMKKNTYRYLCSMMDLHYFPVYSWELLPRDMTQFYGVELMNERYFWDHCVATNISSYDALNVHACNAASKNYPSVVPIQQFKDILRDAIDSIGAFSLLNPEWKALAPTEGVAVTPPPAKSTKEDKHGING